MKKQFYILIILFCSVTGLMSVQAHEKDPLVEKKKTYSKSYPVSSSDKISLSNQFGEMKINTWGKNEVKVDVTITAKGSTDAVAQKILDGITIEDGKSGSQVYFKTKFDNKWQNKNKGNKDEYKEQGMQIDYVVYLPSGNPLDASNQFGPMTIGDYNGPAELESKFGSLTTGNLSNAKDVTVEFGSATIGGISNGDLTIKFSSADIKKLNGNIDTKIEFCDKVKIGMDNSTKGLSVKSSYSKLYLDVPTNLSANFEIRTSFGDFSNKTNFPIKQDREDNEDRGPHFDKKYNGVAGSGSSRVQIRSEFGEVVLGHNLQVDFSEKKKSKKSDTVI